MAFQHLSRCIEINRRSLAGHLSRSIEIYRLLNRSPTVSTSPPTGRNDAEKALASNCITRCLAKLIRHIFYRHDTTLKASASRKTREMATIKCLNCLPHKEFSIKFLPSAQHCAWPGIFPNSVSWPDNRGGERIRQSSTSGIRPAAPLPVHPAQWHRVCSWSRRHATVSTCRHQWRRRRSTRRVLLRAARFGGG